MYAGSDSSHQKRRNSLLRRYSAELVALAERNSTEAMLTLAKQEMVLAAHARAAMWKAQAADRAKGEFLAHMTHELRTPLNAIIGFTELIQLKPESVLKSGKLPEYINDINKAGWHLYRIVNDILDFAKIEAGRLELHEEYVDFAAVLQFCLEMIRGQIEEKNIAFSRDIPASLPMLKVDELKFKQILINLLSNAAKFTPEGGRVTVAAFLEPDDGFIVTVSDTGIGIAAEDIAKVWVPFTQLDSRLSRKYEGTGLGLPLTKALVELHGGSLAIDSTVGVGTTVSLRFSAARVLVDAAAPADREASPQAQPEAAGMGPLGSGGS